MRKSVIGLMALAAMGYDSYHELPYGVVIENRNGKRFRKGSPPRPILTKAQRKRRAASMRAKKARKINRK